MKSESKVIVLQEGSQSFEIEIDGTKDITYRIDKHRSATLYLTYIGSKGQITQHFICEEGAVLRVLIRVQVKEVTLVEESDVYKDASFTIGYLELDEGSSKAKSKIALLETGAQAHYMNACITQNEKHYEVECEHQVPYTKGLIENYAVIQQNANYSMKACGRICKGAHDAESHQTSRVLTLSDQQESVVIPLLLIDENEVKASHATSVGQPDENQLYYLQTRGLSREQALGLLTIGYLLPICQLLDDEVLAQKLKNEIEMKVGLHA